MLLNFCPKVFNICVAYILNMWFINDKLGMCYQMLQFQFMEIKLLFFHEQVLKADEYKVSVKFILT